MPADRAIRCPTCGQRTATIDEVAGVALCASCGELISVEGCLLRELEDAEGALAKLLRRRKHRQAHAR